MSFFGSTTKMPTALDKVKLMVGMEPDTPPELLDELNDCFQLSRLHRLYGFAICVSAVGGRCKLNSV
jgi:hypothetical protein